MHEDNPILYSNIFQLHIYLNFLDLNTNTPQSILLSYFDARKLFLNSKRFSDTDLIYKDLCIIPYLWSVFHLAAIEQNNTIFNHNFDYSVFKVSSLLDCYNKTPLSYLITHTTLDYPSINFMLQYIVDYLQDKGARSHYEIEQIHLSLSPLFKLILNKAAPKIKNRYFSLCYFPALSLEPLPQFGELKTEYTFSNSLMLVISLICWRVFANVLSQKTLYYQRL